MAKIPYGILGPIIGSIGPIIGKKWKDKATISAARVPAKTDKHPTPAQLNQREKFGFVNNFLHGLGPLTKMTFVEQAVGKTEFQCAVGHNVSNAVSGQYPHYTLHYDRVSVGRGTLPNAVLPEAKPGDNPGEILVIWADNTGVGTALATDRAISVACMPGHPGWSSTRKIVTRRSDCSLVHDMGGYRGPVHTWLVFVSESGKASDSVYTGEVILQ